MPDGGFPFRLRGELKVSSPRANFRVVFEEDRIEVVFDRLIDLLRAALDSRRLKKMLKKAQLPATPSWAGKPGRAWQLPPIAVLWKKRRVARLGPKPHRAVALPRVVDG